MSASREELLRILKAVIADLERDGYAATQVAAAMTVIGISRIFGEEKEQALRMLEAARKVVARQEDEEWVQ
jgi:hypothetical protein